MKHQVTALLSRAAGGDRSTHWGLSLLALLAYFPLAIAAHALVGNVALAMAFIPALVWAPLIGPRAAMVGSILLAIPNYYLFIALDAMSTDQETLQLVASHLVIGTLAYIVGYGYSLRRELSRQLEERQRSDARFRGLFENTSDGVFFLSTDLQILDLNNQAASMLGYEAAELIGMDYHQIVVGKEQEDLNQRLKEVLSGKMLPIYQRDFVRKDGSVLSADVNASLIYDRHGSVYHVQSICRDITERKAAEEQLFYKATHDELTGLFNRAMLFTLLDQTITAAQRNDQRFATLFLDLDGFKKVNDSRGHALGDLLLKECAHRLRSLLRGSDILARLGGDEFAVILVPVDDRAFALKVAEKITAALSLPFDLQGEKSLISASVGVSMFPQQAHTSEDLLKLADQDMYQVKQAKYANPKPAASTR
jgi:diguanylate cyclase (GGDEF)-like protein/PAS domain S-box-containing protein